MLKRYLLILFIFSASTYAKSFKTEHFTIEYDENVPLGVVEQLASRVSENRNVILGYLNQSKQYKGTPIKEGLIVYVSKKHRIPYQYLNTIHIPEKRVLSAFLKDHSDKNGMAIIHELVHVYAVSAFRKQKKKGYGGRFFDDGLAVFLQHRFGEAPGYPDFGKDLYRAVAKASVKYGGLIPLAEAETVRNSSKSGIGRRLAYLQEGAFTQFLIENYGLDSYFRLYFGENFSAVTGRTFAELEQDWISLIGRFDNKKSVERH